MTQFQSVVSLAVGRLKDKSVIVVKNAIQLLAAFLSNNPFSSKVIPVYMVDMLVVCLQAEYLQCAPAFDSEGGSFLVLQVQILPFWADLSLGRFIAMLKVRRDVIEVKSYSSFESTVWFLSLGSKLFS